jgi:hypothetical protein
MVTYDNPNRWGQGWIKFTPIQDAFNEEREEELCSYLNVQI